MTSTKVQKAGITDGSIGADQLEDGTIIASDIEDGSITNAKLANSTFTLSGSSVSLGGSVSVSVFVDWQSVITADGSTTTTAVAGQGYFIDTTSASHTINLPSSPSAGDTIAIKDYAGTFGTNNLTIGRNSENIQGAANDSLLSTNRASVVLVYFDATKGWLYTEESNVGDLQAPAFTSATGGTETTSGDFKIHTFTGDGCFVVSQLGNSPTVPTGGPANVDYLVVAGGGGGGKRSAGGGGAGGYRTSFPSPGCNAGAFPVSVTTYPITVGSGGAGDATGSPVCNQKGASGSNSVFSTITSTGGGGGNGTGGTTGEPGGSGGGGNSGTPNVGGSGNTPPVSPPQGNNGGTGFDAPGSDETGAGGGGAGAVGGNGGPGTAGSGGNGSANSITGSSVTYAGGGGGSSYKCGSGTRTPGSGGTGGGGAGGGGTSNLCAVSGTANSGGGGGAGCTSKPSGSGGKGIVVIRYKYQ